MSWSSLCPKGGRCPCRLWLDADGWKCCLCLFLPLPCSSPLCFHSPQQCSPSPKGINMLFVQQSRGALCPACNAYALKPLMAGDHPDVLLSFWVPVTTLATIVHVINHTPNVHPEHLELLMGLFSMQMHEAAWCKQQRLKPSRKLLDLERACLFVCFISPSIFTQSNWKASLETPLTLMIKAQHKCTVDSCSPLSIILWFVLKLMLLYE